MENKEEKRLSQRVYIQLNIEAKIIFPDESITESQFFDGLTENISSEGMKVAVYNLERPMFIKMLHRYPRFLKVKFNNTELGIEKEFTGKIVWLDYHSKRGTKPFCVLGLYFDTFSNSEREEYLTFLQELKVLQKASWI